MKDYLNNINDLYPVRRTKEQKEKFRTYVKTECESFNQQVEVETLNKEHNNIVIGDINEAKVIFTAHYDTPASSIVPNLMIPKNKLLGYLYHFGFPIIIALISLGIAYGIKWILNLDDVAWAIIYVVLYIGSFYLLTRAFTNKHNKNDNTSGVSVVMKLMSMNNNKNVAFVLFDNEEKGLLGSKAFNKAHKELLDNKLVINLDCVGVGENIIVISKEDAIKHPLHKILENTLLSNDDFNVMFYPMKGCRGNSDHKSFKCGVGVMACKKGKIVGYYTSRIHTNKDVIANTENIDFITNKLTDFINKL